MVSNCSKLSSLLFCYLKFCILLLGLEPHIMILIINLFYYECFYVFFMFHKICNGCFAIFTLALTCLLCLACLRSFTNCIFYVSHNLRSNIATFWCCWMFGWIIVDHHVIIVPIKFFMVNWRPIHNNWLFRASFCCLSNNHKFFIYAHTTLFTKIEKK